MRRSRSSVGPGFCVPGFVLAGLVFLTGCPDNPYKAETWVKKLGSREHERALQELEQLGDPSAIPDIGNVWLEHGKPVRDLQVIISLARPLTAAEAKAKFVTDYEEKGRDPNWDAAMPFLTKALLEVDEANARSVDSATKAADALGESRSQAGLDALVEIAVNKPTTKKLFQAQIASIRAIGKFENEKQRAAAALEKIINKDPPPHPRTAKTKEEGRGMEEKYGMFLATSGAAINALGELRIQTAAKTLILSLYKTPELATQIRRALVASGPAAKDELRKALAGNHTEVEQLFKEKRLYEYCGDKGDLPKDQCQPVSLRDFYAALVLGDFHDPKIVPDLLEAMKRKAAPAYYVDEQAGPTQMNAIFDAIKKIGSAEASDTVRAIWMGGAKPAPKGPPKKGAPAPQAGGDGPDLQTRILAINAYAFLARDNQGVKELGAIAEDNGADDNLRQAAAEAFARLARNPGDVGALNKLANKYFEASVKKRAEADGKPKTEADAADKVFAAEKKKNDEAKAEVLKTTRDPNKGAKDIKEATARAKKSDDEFKLAKKKHKEATFPYKNADKAAKDYKTFARMFQSHIARIEVAIRCQNDLACYAKTLSMKPDESYTNVSKYFKIDILEKCKNDVACYQKEAGWSKDGNGANVAKHAASFKDWDKNERTQLLEGNVERAMLEIGKKGAAAESFTELLLDNAKSDNRLIRQSILLALPKIAKVPCNSCEAKLDAAIKAGEGKTTLGELNLETTMLRHYFSWAGGKTPSSPAKMGDDAPAAPKADKPKKK
jgi:predicted transposase YbfD/YdcC